MSKLDVKMSKNFIDRNLKIKGTKYDRGCKLTENQINSMRRLRQKGMPYEKIAKKFDISVHTVYYHTIDGFKEKANKQRLQYGFNVDPNSYNDRVMYKKSLIESGEINLSVCKNKR